MYGNRRDTLNVASELNAAQTRVQEDQAANQRRDAEIAEARRQASEARQGQEAAQQKINQLTATRRLSDEQKTALIKSLAPQKGSEIIIFSASGKECQDYTYQFRKVFQDSGWILSRFPFRIVTREGEDLKILVADVNKPPQRALLIQQSLKAVGIEAGAGVDNTISPDVVEL